MMVNPNIGINLTQNNFSALFHIFSVNSTTVDLLWTKTMSGKYSTMGAAFSEFPPSWLLNEARAGDVGFNISDFNTNLKVKKIIFTSRRRLADTRKTIHMEWKRNSNGHQLLPTKFKSKSI